MRALGLIGGGGCTLSPGLGTRLWTGQGWDPPGNFWVGLSGSGVTFSVPASVGVSVDALLDEAGAKSFFSGEVKTYAARPTPAPGVWGRRGGKQSVGGRWASPWTPYSMGWARIFFGGSEDLRCAAGAYAEGLGTSGRGLVSLGSHLWHRHPLR